MSLESTQRRLEKHRYRVVAQTRAYRSRICCPKATKFFQYLWESAAQRFRRNSNQTLNGPKTGYELSLYTATNETKLAQS